MTNRLKFLAVGLLAASAWLFSTTASTQAGLFGNLEPGCAAPEPTCAAPAPVCAAPAPLCAAPAAPCCLAPCIKYVTRGHHKDCYGCATQQLVLPVKNPCSCCGCAIEVPMCIPACCVGAPCVDSHCGLLGRGVVWYKWPCGFKARVAFRHCGDVVVTYFYR
jgi:hypothetical protein